MKNRLLNILKFALAPLIFSGPLLAHDFTEPFNKSNHIRPYNLEQVYIEYCDKSYEPYLSEIDNLSDVDWDKLNKTVWWAKGYRRCLFSANYVSLPALKFIKESSALIVNVTENNAINVQDKLKSLISLTRLQNHPPDPFLEYQLLKFEVGYSQSNIEQDLVREKILFLSLYKLFNFKEVEMDIDFYITSRFSHNNIHEKNNALAIFNKLNNIANLFDQYYEYKNSLPKYLDSFNEKKPPFLALTQFYLNKKNPFFNITRAEKYLALAKTAEEKFQSGSISPAEYKTHTENTFALFDAVIAEYKENNFVYGGYLYGQLVGIYPPPRSFAHLSPNNKPTK